MKQEMKLLAVTFLVVFLLCGAVSATEPSSDDSKTGAQLINVSVPFVENQGQINPEVSYYANTFYGTSYITTDGITHQITGKDNKTLVVKEQFLDNNGNTIAFNGQGEVPSATLVSYFKGKNPDDWHAQLNTYNFINLGELYPGITVKLRAAGSNIEKLFFVNPGANPDDIRIQIMGTERLTMDADGNLVIKSDGFPDVSMSKPVAFQDDNNNIEAEYEITDNTYQFKIGSYDQTKQLTIDPLLQYSTYLGGTGDDRGNGIAVDGYGNVYITGRTTSADFPTTLGAYQTNLKGYADVFVTKLNPDGKKLIYSTFLGGNTEEYGRGIAVDSFGNAYITGYTGSWDFPTTPGAYQTNLKGSSDVFVTKLNSDGTALLYSTFLGGDRSEWGYGIAVDANGNAYITGRTTSDNFPTTLGAYQTNLKGSSDVFVTKLNPDGKKLLYSTFLGGTGDDSVHGIAVDGYGNVYITGRTTSADFPTTSGAYQTNHQGSWDVFVTKLNLDGKKLLYSTFLGGTGDDRGNGIAVDANGNAYLTGETRSTDFPTTSGAYQTNHQGSWDVFVTKLNPAGTTLIYSTYLGGKDGDDGFAIAVDGNGNAYITGETSSDDFPITPGAYQTNPQGNVDAFVTKLNPTGTTLTYSSYFGGNKHDEGRAIAVDGNGNVYITGITSSSVFPITPGAYQTNYQGGFYDVFVAKLSTVQPVTHSVTMPVKADGEPKKPSDPSSKTVHAKTIGMQKTGLPIMPLALAILSILGAIATQRKNE